MAGGRINHLSCTYGDATTQLPSSSNRVENTEKWALANAEISCTLPQSILADTDFPRMLEMLQMKKSAGKEVHGDYTAKQRKGTTERSTVNKGKPINVDDELFSQDQMCKPYLSPKHQVQNKPAKKQI